MTTVSPTPIILLGYGGNVVDVVDMLDDLADLAADAGGARFELLGYLDNRDELQGQSFHGYPVLGRLADAARFVERYRDVRFTTWIGGSTNYLRRPRMIASLGVPPYRFQTLIHPTAYVSRRARVGRGALILQQCTISNGAVVGDHVVILQGAVAAHDCVLADYAIVTSAVTVGSRAQIERSTYLGTQCTMLPGVKIGEGSLVGAGSVVLRDVDPHTVVVGNPARVLRRTHPDGG
jgi:sugar O-acyltransferase (sialic acid O-acetyltransferase NeuD family)